MKLLNYDAETLIYQNVKPAEKYPSPDTYTKSQYKILCNLIRRRGITKPFFDFIVSGLFDISDWKELIYE